MTVNNDMNLSPWNVPPIDHSTPLGASESEYHKARQTVTAPRPNRPVTQSARHRPGSIETFTWVATHGGAGATSLAVGSGHGLDLSGEWPDPSLGWPTATVLVCRSNAAGLDSMGRMLQEWVSRSVPQVDVVAVVIVPDAPTKPSKRIRSRIQELRSIVSVVINMQWVEDWRDLPYVPHPAALRVAEAINSAQAQDV